MSTVIFPTKMTKAQCLLNLWNATNPLGLGRLSSHNTPTLADAQHALDECERIDYWIGKPIKTNFESYPVLNRRGYDRDAGAGKMQNVADGVADYIGPSKKLNKHDKVNVKNEADNSIKIVSMSSPSQICN